MIDPDLKFLYKALLVYGWRINDYSVYQNGTMVIGIIGVPYEEGIVITLKPRK